MPTPGAMRPGTKEFVLTAGKLSLFGENTGKRLTRLAVRRWASLQCNTVT